MAKIWTISEAAKAIHERDIEGIRELGRRFPLLTVTLAKIDYESTKELFEAIPGYVTGVKMEKRLSGEEKDELAEEEPQEIVEEGGSDSEGDGAKEAAEEDPQERKRRIDRERQRRKRDKDKALKEASEDAESEESKGKYDEIGAVDLYKMCKKRGIPAEPKKSQRFYIDLLEADDMKPAKEEAAEDDVDWGDDEEEEAPVKEPEKPKKNSSAKKSPSKKKEPEPEPEPEKEADEDDDGDWDF